MALFCGKKCRCKKRCEDFFTEEIDHVSYTSSYARMCKNACKNNKEITPEAFLQTLNENQIRAYESDISLACYYDDGSLISKEDLEIIYGPNSPVNLECTKYAPSKAKQDFVKVAIVFGLLAMATVIFLKSK